MGPQAPSCVVAGRIAGVRFPCDRVFVSHREPSPIKLVDLLGALAFPHVVSGALIDEQLRVRSKVMRVCDSCDDDYADEEGACVSALHPYFLKGRTICRRCIDGFRFTGCRFTGQDYEVHLFGHALPPDWWELSPPTWDELRTGLILGSQTWTPRRRSAAA